MASPQPPKTIFVPYDVLESAEVVVTQTPSTLLPGHRVLVAGTNIVFDATTPNELTINGTGGGGGVPAHAPTHEPGGSDPLTVDAVPATGSLRTLGPGANQAAPGNDSRFTDARPPTAHHLTHEPGGSDPLAVDAVPATGSLRTLGTGPNQATAGDDSRLSNARTPTAHKTTHEPGGADAMTVDAAAVTGSLRTLGSGANQAAPGNDARFTDARTPTAHKATHQTGGTDVVDVKLLGGYPGGTTFFLRADGTFQIPPGTGVPYTGATTNVDLGAFNLYATKVGVGNTAPQLSLHVGPATTMLAPYPGAVVVGPPGDVAQVVAKSNIQGCEMVMLAHAADGIFGTWSNHPLQFRTNATAKVSISTVGVLSALSGLNAGVYLGVPQITVPSLDSWNPAGLDTAFTLQIYANQPCTLHGLKAQGQGRLIHIVNIDAPVITLSSNTSGVQADRFLLPNHTNVSLGIYQSVFLIGFAAGWFLVAKS